MVKTINLTTNVAPDHEVHIKLPSDVPLGPVDIIVTVSSHIDEKPHTLGDLARSEFFGMWKDRKDIADSSEFARHLRSEGWRRSA